MAVAEQVWLKGHPIKSNRNKTIICTTNVTQLLTVHFLAPPLQPPTNVLVLLHGIGDTDLSFKTFAEKLQLPETACLSVRAPTPLPFDLGGFYWGDDILIDEATGEMDYDSGFTKSTPLLLEKLISQCLIEKCGYRPREVLLFGFGQGGMVALDVAARFEHGTQQPQPSKSFKPSPLTGGSLKMGPTDYKLSDATGDSRDGLGLQEELGGVISIGGYIPHTTPPPKKDKYKSPILLCKAKSRSVVNEHHVDRLKDLFQYVQVVEWKKAGDSMPSSREEMMPIMEFFSRRLRSTKGVPEGSVEIT